MSVDPVRDYVDGQVAVLVQRINDIDRASALLSSISQRVPSEVERQVGHVREVHAERFLGITQQFAERDHRSERESRDNKVAVDAAFAAQKEAAAEQNRSNTLAISKSETAQTEAILKLEQLVQVANGALVGKISDLTERINRFDGARSGASSMTSLIFGLIGALGILASVITSVIIATRH